MAFSKKRSAGSGGSAGGGGTSHNGDSNNAGADAHRGTHRAAVGGGRSEKRKRGGVIGFRASDEERKQIEAAADRAGLTPSSYIRSRALATPTTRAVRRAPASTAQLAQLLGMLGAVGGAIEQMNSADGDNMTLQAAALAEFRLAASAILQSLGKRPHDY